MIPVSMLPRHHARFAITSWIPAHASVTSTTDAKGLEPGADPCRGPGAHSTVIRAGNCVQGHETGSGFDHPSDHLCSGQNSDCSGLAPKTNSERNICRVRL